MTATNGPKMDLHAFEALLDAFGSDRSRWPGMKRVQADALLAESADARRALSEAQALDRLLAHADAEDDVEPADLNLVDRIVARAAATPRLAVSGPATTGAKTPPVARLPASAASRSQVRLTRGADLWRNVSLVAASLIAGLYIGQSQLSLYAVPALESITGQTLTDTISARSLPEITVDIGDDE